MWITSILRVPSSSIQVPSFVFRNTPAIPNDTESIKPIIPPKCFQSCVQFSKIWIQKTIKAVWFTSFFISGFVTAALSLRKSEFVRLPKPCHKQRIGMEEKRMLIGLSLLKWNDYSDFGQWRGILQLLLFNKWVNLLLGKKEKETHDNPSHHCTIRRRLAATIYFFLD